MTLRPFLLFLIAAGIGRAATAEPVAAPVTVPARTPPAAAVKTAPARTESSVAPTASFDTFRLVSDRNIFNPNRTGRRDRTAEEKPPRTDMIALVGTMESERGLRAFFDGSETGYRKALRVGESVDKFKVTQITPTVVDLERDGKNLSVKVGQQLRRPEGADWDLIGEDVVRREAEARALAESKADPAAAVVVAPPASEIEKRMRERRKKDFKDKDFKN